MLEYLCTFTMISRRIIRVMRNVTDRSCKKNENAPYRESGAVREIA
jgi:hypothetical protein